MTIFERLEAWKAAGTGRGWELRSLSSGFYLVALFDGERFVCDGKWATPDGAFVAAEHRWQTDPKAASCASKEVYLQAVGYSR